VLVAAREGEGTHRRSRRASGARRRDGERDAGRGGRAGSAGLMNVSLSWEWVAALGVMMRHSRLRPRRGQGREAAPPVGRFRNPRYPPRRPDRTPYRKRHAVGSGRHERRGDTRPCGRPRVTSSWRGGTRRGGYSHGRVDRGFLSDARLRMGSRPSRRSEVGRQVNFTGESDTPVLRSKRAAIEPASVGSLRPPKRPSAHAKAIRRGARP
jgi:hypothetical protein